MRIMRARSSGNIRAIRDFRIQIQGHWDRAQAMLAESPAGPCQIASSMGVPLPAARRSAWLDGTDVLAERDGFRQRGLTGLVEQVYLLQPLEVG